MSKGHYYPEEIKQKAIELRKLGYTYSEIPSLLNCPIPKNTFTGWFKNVILSKEAQERIIEKIREGGAPGRAIAWQNTKKRRALLINDVYKRMSSRIKRLTGLHIQLCLAMLYLGEGGKTGELFRFGNSDPMIISLFLELLRRGFSIKEEKLHGKVQCRADQDIAELECYWSEITKIPINQFLKPQIDKRTIGKPTKKLDYKGVFVIEYYSTELFLEVKAMSDIIYRRINLGR